MRAAQGVCAGFVGEAQQAHADSLPAAAGAANFLAQRGQAFRIHRQGGLQLQGFPARPLAQAPQRLNVSSRSEEHTSELQSLAYLVCRLLLEKKKTYRVEL